MSLMGKFFGKSTKKDDSQDIMEIARVIGPLIDKSANDIFITYGAKLIIEPITYIIPAVWGAGKDGALTPTQKEIHQVITPVFDEVFKALKLRGLSGAQEFAIGFLIKGLFISKITYMIEMVKNTVNDEVKVKEDKDENYLERVKPLGNA